jgi:hypothetical protein
MVEARNTNVRIRVRKSGIMSLQAESHEAVTNAPRTGAHLRSGQRILTAV